MNLALLALVLAGVQYEPGPVVNRYLPYPQRSANAGASLDWSKSSLALPAPDWDCWADSGVMKCKGVSVSVINGAPNTVSAPHKGRAIAFDGSDDWLKLGATPIPSGDYTLVVTWYGGSATGNHRILNLHGSTLNGGSLYGQALILAVESGTLKLYHAGATVYKSLSCGTPNTADWNTATFSFDASASTIACTLNGKQAWPMVTDQTEVAYAAANPLAHLGAKYDEATELFDGRLARVTMWHQLFGVWTGGNDADAGLVSWVKQRQSTAPAARQVISVGDSIAAGSAVVGSPWLTYLNTLMNLDAPSLSVGVGIGSMWTTNIKTQLTTYAAGRGYGWVVIEGGVNDLNGGTAATTIESTVADSISAAIAGGSKVVLLTVGPWAAYTGSTIDEQLETDTFNTWLRGQVSAGSVYLVDASAALADPTTPANLKATWDYGDHLHWNNDAHRYVAGLIQDIVAPPATPWRGLSTPPINCVPAASGAWSCTGATATKNGTPATTADGCGGSLTSAILYDGDTDWHDLGTVARMTGSFMVCADYRTDVNPAGQLNFLAAVHPISGNAQWWFGNYYGALMFRIHKTNAAYSAVQVANGTGAIGKWHRACGSYQAVADGTSVLRIAVDGIAGTAVANGVYPPQTTTATSVIGASSDGANYEWQGAIGRVSIWPNQHAETDAAVAYASLGCMP